MSASDQPIAHTPGPWDVKGPSQNGHCRRIFAGDEYVAIVGGSDQPMKTIRANADLVAAAPEFLEFLESFVAEWESEWYEPDEVSHEWHKFYRQAKELIRKAKGGNSAV